MTSSFYIYRSVLLLAILAFAFFARMNRLYIPAGYMFDEVYHALTAKLIARNDPRAYEWWNVPVEEGTAVDWLHPPLAKYTQALSILAFGENSFGWRFSSVVFGTLVIMMTYHLAYRLFDNYAIALLAAFLASLDGLLLAMSRIAMNDIHVTFFILLTFHYYWTYRKNRKYGTLFLAGLAGGLAVGSKWSGLFAIIYMLFSESIVFILDAIKIVTEKKIARVQEILKLIFAARYSFVFLFCLPIVIYILSYSHMFLQGKNFQHFIDLHKQIWWYQTNLTATHPYQSRPIEWFLDTRPVWMNVSYLPEKKERADIYAFGNPVLFWIGCATVVMTLTLLLTKILNFFFPKSGAKIRAKNILKLLIKAVNNPLFFLIFGYFIVWAPWEFSPRIMFFYHYTPAVPLLCILIAYWCNRIWKNSKNNQLPKAAIVVLIATILVCFIVWYPHWVGIPVPETFADTVYFAISSWK